MALRYLRSARRDAFITFLSAAAVAGIAVGVGALILALAALSGFQAALRDEILERTPEIEIELPAGTPAAAVRDAVARVPGVRATQRVLRGRGWLLARGGAHPVELVGHEGAPPPSFPGAGDGVAGDGGPGLYVGEHLAELWALGPGAIVEVASIRPTLTPLGPQPRLRRLRVAGTYQSGRTEQLERVALPIEEAALLLDAGSERLLVSTGDLRRALRVAPELGAVLPAGARVRTWQDLNRALFFALRLEKLLMFVAVLLIVVVAAMSLISDLMLILASKTREIGMLGAMGARPGELARLFLWLGGALVGAGGAAGLAAGLGGAWLLDHYRLLALPRQVYFLDHVPFQVQGADLAAVLAATATLTLWSALYAARRAAALEPVEALRR